MVVCAKKLVHRTKTKVLGKSSQYKRKEREQNAEQYTVVLNHEFQDATLLVHAPTACYYKALTRWLAWHNETVREGEKVKLLASRFSAVQQSFHQFINAREDFFSAEVCAKKFWFQQEIMICTIVKKAERNIPEWLIQQTLNIRVLKRFSKRIKRLNVRSSR